METAGTAHPHTQALLPPTHPLAMLWFEVEQDPGDSVELALLQGQVSSVSVLRVGRKGKRGRRKDVRNEADLSKNALPILVTCEGLLISD